VSNKYQEKLSALPRLNMLRAPGSVAKNLPKPKITAESIREKYKKIEGKLPPTSAESFKKLMYTS
jgi:hypothetical protein